MNPSIDINFANALIEPWTNNVDIYLAIKSANQISVADALTFKSYPLEGSIPVASSIRLTRPGAQGLMDALWRCDIRPSSHLDQKTETKALEVHLADMRQIAFKKLGVQKP